MKRTLGTAQLRPDKASYKRVACSYIGYKLHEYYNMLSKENPIYAGPLHILAINGHYTTTFIEYVAEVIMKERNIQ